MLKEFRPISGDKYFVSSDIGLKFYKTLFHFDEVKTNKNAVVFQFKNNFGIINPYNDYILRIEDRFFLSEFRGFKQISGVSPRDIDGKTIGGDKYFFGSAQIEAPLNLIQDLDIKIHAFIDYGNVFVDKNNIFSQENLVQNNIISYSKKIRLSAGIGLYAITPFTPISVAIAKPIIYEKDLDVKKYLYFSLVKRI